MSGCSTCASECGRKDGCGTRKQEQQVILDRLVASLYPSKTWGQPNEVASIRQGLSEREVQRLRQNLSVVLQAPTFYEEGAAEDYCSFVYVLCVGREPPLLQVRNQGIPLLVAGGAILEPKGPLRLQERYLRLSLSRLSRVAAVQEVAFELELGEDGFAILREIPQPGVFDAKLLKRFQKTVDLLLAEEIEHLDMGLLDVPASAFGLAGGEYSDLYGMVPSLFNFFFHAQPVVTASATYLNAD